jgi:hypothetical protein
VYPKPLFYKLFLISCNMGHFEINRHRPTRRHKPEYRTLRTLRRENPKSIIVRLLQLSLLQASWRRLTTLLWYGHNTRFTVTFCTPSILVLPPSCRNVALLLPLQKVPGWNDTSFVVLPSPSSQIAKQDLDKRRPLPFIFFPIHYESPYNSALHNLRYHKHNYMNHK